MVRTKMRQYLSFVLSLVLILGFVPTAWASQEQTEDPIASVSAPEIAATDAEKGIPDQAYDPIKEVFEEISQMEDAPAKRNTSEAELSRCAEEIVKQSDSYVPGSLERNGSVFTWKTVDGISCIYHPDMRKEIKAPEKATADGVYNWPEKPSGRDVFLLAPFYGYDDQFKEDYYKQQAENAAKAIGDTDGYTLVSGTAVTIDIISYAISYGAIVFLDSHGTTNYKNTYNEWDRVSGATANYMIIRSARGLSVYLDGDALVSYDDNGNLVYGISGKHIANHMRSNQWGTVLPYAPNSIVWMAFCYSMATEAFCKPLRDCGVEVVYGYSESISFAGDYCYEMNFWPEFLKGSTVSKAMAKAKKKVGYWDYNTTVITNLYKKLYGEYVPTCDDINTANECYIAFPVIVSDEDPYPGQRTATSYGVDNLQDVKSTYTLLSREPVVQSSDGTTYTSFAEALENYDSTTQYLTLLQDQQVELTVNQDLYIDLNGHNLTGVIDFTSGQLYGMDSTTDEYTCENVGYFRCEDSRGSPVVPKKHFKSSITGQIKRYVTLQTTEGYSFHRIYLAVNYMTIRPSVTGVGYKAVFYGDSMVADALDAQNAFGYSMQVQGYEPKTGYKPADSFVSGNSVTLRIDNYDVEKFGTTELKASAILKLADGTTIFSSEVSMTMRGLMEALNDEYSNLTADQLTAIKAMIERSPVIKTWNVENLY